MRIQARSNLRLKDLTATEDVVQIRLMNTMVPTELINDIARIAEELKCTKTNLIVALINEGLDAAESQLRGIRRRPKPIVPVDRRCHEPGCEKRIVAKGHCSTHYQATRRGKVAGGRRAKIRR